MNEDTKNVHFVKQNGMDKSPLAKACLRWVKQVIENIKVGQRRRRTKMRALVFAFLFLPF
jgi:hypothetical protein